jgi:tetratricopeptide (TPR) repeat protein
LDTSTKSVKDSEGLSGASITFGEPKTVWRRSAIIVGTVLAAIYAGGCAPTRSYTPAPVPGWSYAAGQFSTPPASLSPQEQATFEQGWQALIEGNLETAARLLEGLGRDHRDDPSLDAALGYLELRMGNRQTADNRFVVALKKEPKMAAAQVGWFITALAAGDEEAAFHRLRLLSRDHPDNPLVAEYLPTLQLKVAETKLQRARSLRQQKQYREAAEVYRQALEIAPEASGLHIEVAKVELEAGEPRPAAEHAAQAIALEPRNVEAYRLRGDALRAMGDLELALEAYRQAMLRSPEDGSLAGLYQQTKRAFERESLPSQFFSIAESPKLSREQLSALLFVKLRPAFDGAPRRADVIATDIGDSWAHQFIREVVSAGILDVYPNHTFQPRAFVRRAELAVGLASAMNTLAPGETPKESPRVSIADVPPNNLNYRPVALAVFLGLLPTDASGRFNPQRFVSGREGVAAVDSLARRVIP